MLRARRSVAAGQWTVALECRWHDGTTTSLTVSYPDDVDAREVAGEVVKNHVPLVGDMGDCKRATLTIEHSEDRP